MVEDTYIWFIVSEIQTLLIVQTKSTMLRYSSPTWYNNLSLVNRLVSFILHHLAWAMCPNHPLTWEALLFSYIIKPHPQLPAYLWFVKFLARAANGSYLKTVLYVRFFWKSRDPWQKSVIWDLADIYTLSKALRYCFKSIDTF